MAVSRGAVPMVRTGWRVVASAAFNRTWKNSVTCLWVLVQPLGTRGKVFERDMCPTLTPPPDSS